MARCPQFAGNKGSKRWIQKLVNERPEILGSLITENLKLAESEHIHWLSPLKSDEYSEYSDRESLDLLGVRLEKRPLSDFWPENGPQWDALGRSDSGNLFLVEAKSHISELHSAIGAKDKNSVNKIRQSLKEIRDFLNSKSENDWSQSFYQYANRLAHLYLLRQNDLSAYLILVYFLNDFEMAGPTTLDQWKDAIELIHAYMGINKQHKLQKYMAEIFIDINHF